tara:strand:- start:269 stop:481 length:213 start_codon:yes stop_codon:yes gene_type:complete
LEITLLKKKLVLVVGHSSWWKRNKHRNESTIILKEHKFKGWKLKKVEKIDKDEDSIETRDFKKYFLLKKN